MGSQETQTKKLKPLERTHHPNCYILRPKEEKIKIEQRKIECAVNFFCKHIRETQIHTIKTKTRPSIPHKPSRAIFKLEIPTIVSRFFPPGVGAMQGRNVSFLLWFFGQEVWNFEEVFAFFCPEKFGNGQWGRADKKESLPLLFNSWHCGHLSDEHLSVLDERTIR